MEPTGVEIFELVMSRVVSTYCPGFWLIVHYCVANQEPACLLTKHLTMTATHKCPSLQSADRVFSENGGLFLAWKEKYFDKIRGKASLKAYLFVFCSTCSKLCYMAGELSNRELNHILKQWRIINKIIRYFEDILNVKDISKILWAIKVGI